MNRLPMLITLVLSAALFSCGVGKNDYSDFKNLPQNGWAYGDSLRFIPTIADSVAGGVLTVAIRHNNEYRYGNLWLEVTARDDKGRICRDTVNMQLSDSYGRWRGHGFGVEYQYADTVKGIRGVMRDSAIIVRHVMRVDNLTDIEQLGVTFVSPDR